MFWVSNWFSAPSTTRITAFSQLRHLGVQTLFPSPSPQRRSSVGRSSSPPPPSRLDAETLLRQRNRLAFFSVVSVMLTIVWRIWWASLVEEVEAFSGAGVSSVFTTYPSHPISGAWPPSRPDSASFLSPYLVPVTLGGMEDAWVAAPSALNLAESRGIALLFHGCGHRGEVWATGGGGQAALVEELIKAKLLPVALTSADSRGMARGSYSEGHGCWDSGTWHDPHAPQSALSWGEDNSAVHRVVNELGEYWKSQQGGFQGSLPPPPLIAVGVSSGGAFLSQLALHLPIRSAAIYIMPLLPSVPLSLLDTSTTNSVGVVSPDVLQRARAAAAAAGHLQAATPTTTIIPSHVSFPNPLILLHMPLDSHTASRITANIDTLIQKKGYTPGLSLIHLRVLPQALSAHNFTLHFPEASPARIREGASQVLFTALESNRVFRETPAPGTLSALSESWSLGAWWCRDGPTCAQAQNAAPAPRWLDTGARGDLVEEAVGAFCMDIRLKWVDAPIGGGGDGGFPCDWTWSDVQQPQSLGVASSIPCSHAESQTVPVVGVSGDVARAEARRVLCRGLREVIRESEGGHEMTSVHAATVVSELIKAL